MLKEKISFQISHLKSLLESEDSCVTIVKNFKGKLSLYPFHLGYLKHAVKELLDNQVSKYDPELNGIVLGHSNIKVINYLQHSDCSTFNLSYIADIYLFTPVVGKKLTGVVNKQSKEHIGCLIHSAFNATIPKPRVKGEVLNVWLRTHGSVQIGSELDFTVSKVDFSSRVPYISGTIIKQDTDFNDDGADSGVCCHDSVDESSTKTKKKKRKSKENAQSTSENDLKIDGLSYHDPDKISELLNPKLQPTKGKRKNSKTNDTMTDSGCLSPPPVKKIKKERFSEKSPESEYAFPLPIVIKKDEDDSSLPGTLDKIKRERLSVTPTRLKSPIKKSKSNRTSLDRNETININQAQPTIEDLTSSLLKEAMDSCFSPKHNSTSSSSESDRKKKHKNKSNKYKKDSESLNLSSGSKSILKGNSPVPKLDVNTPETEERRSKKRKKSESPSKLVEEDSFMKKGKKKSRKSKDNLDQLTDSLLAETLSHLK